MRTLLNNLRIPLAIENSRLMEVQKETIPALHFPKEEVLKNSFDKLQRDKDLRRSLVLGNCYRFKVKIVFEDIGGFKQVCTTLWGVTDKSLILKRNVIIPIHRIHGIKY